MGERIEGQKRHFPLVRLQPTGQVILRKGGRKGKEGMVVVGRS